MSRKVRKIIWTIVCVICILAGEIIPANMSMKAMETQPMVWLGVENEENEIVVSIYGQGMEDVSSYTQCLTYDKEKLKYKSYSIDNIWYQSMTSINDEDGKITLAAVSNKGVNILSQRIVTITFEPLFIGEEMAEFDLQVLECVNRMLEPVENVLGGTWEFSLKNDKTVRYSLNVNQRSNGCINKVSYLNFNFYRNGGLYTGEFEIEYDEKVLMFSDVQLADGMKDLLVEGTITEPGKVKIAFASLNPITKTDDIFKVGFIATEKTSNEYLQIRTIKITDLELNEIELPEYGTWMYFIDDEGDNCFKINTPESVQYGEELEVPIEIRNNSGFSALTTSLLYDETMFEYMGCEFANGILANAFTTCSGKIPGKLNIAAVSAKDIEESGELAAVKFKVVGNERKLCTFKMDMQELIDQKAVPVEYSVGMSSLQVLPSEEPSEVPSESPSEEPSESPSEEPSMIPNLLDVKFDFNDVTLMADGSVINGKNAKAVVKSGCSYEEVAEGDYALVLDGMSQWLDITKTDGNSLLAGVDEVSISYDVKGKVGQWGFYIAPSTDTNIYQSETYYASFCGGVERYHNGRDVAKGSVSINSPTEIDADGWKHIEYRTSAKCTKILVNGEEVASVEHAVEVSLSTLLGKTPIFQFGKANWGTGEYGAWVIDNLVIKASGDIPETPIEEPSMKPSDSPSETPSIKPSESPSKEPSAKPSESPSEVPSVKPSESPSVVPGIEPSIKPSVKPIKVRKIGITAVSKQIAAGKKVSLKVIVQPSNAKNKKVAWSSSNKKYATVSSKGVVVTKKAGAGKSVIITAKSLDGSNKKATMKLQIMKDAVKSIKIITPLKTVKAGKSVQLKTSIKTTGKRANKTLQWKSSNTKYAVVTSKGKVLTKKSGKGKTVTITASSTDGTNKKAMIRFKIK